MPYTTRTQFGCDELVNVHYKRIEESQFDLWAKENLFVQDQAVEEGLLHAETESSGNFPSPGKLTVSSNRHLAHCCKQQGTLVSDVRRITDNHKVALIECELQDAIRTLQQKESNERLANSCSSPLNSHAQTDDLNNKTTSRNCE